MKFLIGFVLSLLVASCFAKGNDFCDSQRNVQGCYNTAIRNQKEETNFNMNRLKANKFAGAAKIKILVANQREWEVEINNRCRGKQACLYDSYLSRNRELRQERKTLGV